MAEGNKHERKPKLHIATSDLRSDKPNSLIRAIQANFESIVGSLRALAASHNSLDSAVSDTVDHVNAAIGGIQANIDSGVLRGAAGFPGADGEDGEPGPPGRIGVDGAAGAAGGTGPTGPPGTDGEDGEPGPPGPPGAEGGVGHSFIGTNAIGPDQVDLNTNQAYAKQVTMAADGWLTSVDVYFTGASASPDLEGLSGQVWTDDAGEPGLLIGGGGDSGGRAPIFDVLQGRWFQYGVGVWLVAGTYWIGFTNLAHGAASIPTVAADLGGGTDRTGEVANYPSSDWAIYTSPANSTNDYSIRASVASPGGNIGPTGVAGAAGVMGPPGMWPSSDGEDGEPGVPGRAGVDGAAGAGGAAGAAGAEGAVGPTGPMGPPGMWPSSDGEDGEPGPPGAPGAAGSGSGGHVIQDEGGAGLTARANLNFVGAGVTATDDAGNNQTDVTITEPTADTHIALGTDAHDASAISVLDTAGHFAATNVETALAELAENSIVWLFASKVHPEIGIGRRMYAPYAATITSIYAWCSDSAPTSTMTADVLKNGTSVCTTKPTVSAAAYLGTAVTDMATTAIAQYDKLEVEIEATGGADGRINVAVVVKQT